jgi:glycosyltransferase involved in cell wall biosynthesis
VSRRIVHVLAPAPYGGLERVVHALAVGQQSRGDDVSVIALVDAGAPEVSLLPELRAEGVRVAPLALPARAYGAQLALLGDTVSRLRPDVLHSHGYLADVLVALSSWRGNSAIVSTVHGFTGGDWKNRLYEWMQRRAYRRFDAVVAVSGRLASDLTRGGVPAKRLHALPNAWASGPTPLVPPLARELLAVPDDAFSIGWVGRVSHEKGLDVLVDALPRLADLNWRLTVLGDGRERMALERRVQELGLASRVNWRGVVANAAEVMRAFDLLVLSSRTEGTPMTLFEAMHGGVPVVTTAVGGIPDVVSPDEALLVASEDPRALASAIRAVRDDREGAAWRVARARERLSTEFGVHRWLERYDRIYDGIHTPAQEEKAS